MAKKYVYGWYHYADGTNKEFRYPSDKESDLRNNGKKITVEVTEGRNIWGKRRGVVSYSGGNYIVTPA
jgi:hypothetical protein